MPATVRQGRRRGFSGSIRRAAADNNEETLGATLSWTTWPARSTCGAAQARVVTARCLAAAPTVFASGIALPAAGRSAAAAWRARCQPPPIAFPVRWCALLRDIETSAGVYVRPYTSPKGRRQPFEGVHGQKGSHSTALGRGSDRRGCRHQQCVAVLDGASWPG